MGAFLRIYPESNQRIVLFGEWCGSNIQKNVGISQLPKMFVVFAAKLDDEWVSKDVWREWFSGVDYSKLGIYSIYDFPTFSLKIDFDQPEMSIAELNRITEEVEKQCPVALHFGVDGIGEGVVWLNHEHNLRFKVKGEKHSVSKVKTLAAVDTVKLENINEFINYALTDNRMKQAIAEVNPDMQVEKMGDFLRWLYNDIVKEESDTMTNSNIDPKTIGKYISAKAKKWFFENQFKEAA